MIATQLRKGDYDISFFRRIKSKYLRLYFSPCLSSLYGTLCLALRGVERVARVRFLLVLLPVSGCAQSGLQRLDERILEDLAAGRTGGQTRFWRDVSNANNYVNAAI